MPVPSVVADDLFVPPANRYAVVFVGPCTVESLRSSKIPLDGRKYIVHGDVEFRTGRRLRARLVIDTTDFDFLELDGTFVHLDGTWYSFEEHELYTAMGTSREHALPFTWEPDIPLDYDEQPPYPMRFYSGNPENA